MDAPSTPNHACQSLAKLLLFICFFLDYVKVYQDSFEDIYVTYVGNVKEYDIKRDETYRNYLGGDCDDQITFHLVTLNNAQNWCNTMVANVYVTCLVLIISGIGMGMRRMALFDPDKIKGAMVASLICAFLTVLMPSLVLSQTPNELSVCAAPVVLSYFACGLYVVCIFLDIRLKNFLGV